MPRNENIRTAIFVILFVFLSLCPASLHYTTKTDIPHADSLENVMNAWSFYDDESASSNRREPLYPLFLAGIFHLSPDEAFKANGFKCFETENLCPDFIGKTKKINWLFHVLTTLLVGLFILKFTNRRTLALTAMAFISFNTAMISASNSWLTESQATLFLLVHSVCLYGMFFRPHRLTHALCAGLSLGALILTKSLFMYLFYLYIPIIAFLLIRRTEVKPVLLALLGVLFILAPWAARNYAYTSAIDIAKSDRGGQVLAIRAEYDTMPWSEVLPAMLYFTPGGKDPVRYYDEEIYSHFNRENAEGYYGRVKNSKGAAYDLSKAKNISLESAALQVITQNGLKHIVLTPIFAWQGLFLPDDIHLFKHKPLIGKILTFIASLFALILTIASAIWLLQRKEWAYLLLFLPGAFSFGFCSFLTHNWPRYSLPLLAIALVCIAVTWHIREQRKTSHGG